MNPVAKALLAVLTALLVALAVVLGWLHVEQREKGPFAGTTIGGYLPARTEGYSDWLLREQVRRRGAPVVVTGAGQRFEVTLSDLGIEIDVAAMLHQAERQREMGSIFAQTLRFISAKRHGQDLVWLTRFDRERATDTLLALGKWVAREPVNAEVDLLKRRRVEARSGERLDIAATLDWLERHRDVELSEVELVVQTISPEITAAQVSPIDLGKVLASFETDFRTRAGTRAINIRTAARALNGVVLGPGATFSFNDVVGPRVESRGYREAPVIVDDELEPGVGGGVCQVATTLHAAAVLAGFEVLERRSHSRPSGYAPMGLDATVIDGKVDLKLRNPYPVSLLIATSFPERFRLRVEFVGMLPSAHYEHQYTVRKRYDFYRRVVSKPDLAVGSFQRKQKGIYGYDVISTVSAKGMNTRGRFREYRSKYWPVPEVYWVGPETDLQVLPPLPSGATGVQRDGVTVMGQIPSDVEARAAETESAKEWTEE